MLKITNAKIIKDHELQEVTLIIENGRIKDIISGKAVSLRADEEIDLKGKVTFPGFIDPHVPFDDPGFTEREDFYTGARIAAVGGRTRSIDMPCTYVG